jgi:hypothetical protein
MIFLFTWLHACLFELLHAVPITQIQPVSLPPHSTLMTKDVFFYIKTIFFIHYKKV